MNRFLINFYFCLAAVGLLLASASSGHADTQTNTATNPATNRFGLTFSIDTDHKNDGTQNYFGMPKEAFDRLSPEQIVELAQAHQKTFDTERIPELLESIMIPVAMFTMIAVCVGLGVNSRLKRSKMQHDTLRLMIEKGQPIPPELLQPQEARCRPRSDLRRGLIFIATGIGLCAFFLVQHNGIWPVSLIPLLIGVAFLITWKLESNDGASK